MSGGIYWPFARKRPSFYIPLPRNVPFLREKAICLYRPRSRRIRWTIDDRIPIYGVEQDRMEYLEEVLWCTRFHTAHEVGV
jgi:hypothetical protein